jgi:hypothetical protein
MGSRVGPKAIVLGIMAVVIVVPAAIGFVTKFVYFVRTLRTDSAGSFAILPMVNYLAVAAGFFCLLIWAAFRGMFRDIEGPKYTMLDREDRLDRGEPLEEIR